MGDLRHTQLSESNLQDRHNGEIVFVVGAGPSLHFQDMDLLREHIVIAVNSALPKVPFCDYFVADDIGVKHWNYYQDILPKLYCTSILYREKLKDEASHLRPDQVVWFNHKWWFDPKSGNYNPDGLVMTKDITKPIIGARTTAGSAVHLAHIMGGNPIVLLGCDCCYHGRNRYYWQFPGEVPCFRHTGEKVFSTPNKGVKNGRPVDSHSMDFLEYWKALAEKAEESGIHIIDASDGLLDCFEQMTLEEVLSNYDSR
jgi:hypothetical protein